MHIVLVQIHIKAEYNEVFQNASLDNARNSIQEPGVVRFDVLQQQEDPTRFTLVEVYRKAEDQLKHRETTHYLRWKDAVEPMMAESRVGIKYTNLFPSDTDWS